jgi:hypothetical protein
MLACYGQPERAGRAVGAMVEGSTVIRRLTAVAVAIESALLGLFTFVFTILVFVLILAGDVNGEVADALSVAPDIVLVAAFIAGLVLLIGCGLTAAICLWVGGRGPVAMASIIIVTLGNAALMALWLSAPPAPGAEWIPFAFIGAVTAGCLLSMRRPQAVVRRKSAR